MSVIPNTWEAKAGGLWLQGQPGLHSEVQASLGYIGRAGLQNKRKTAEKDTNRNACIYLPSNPWAKMKAPGVQLPSFPSWVLRPLQTKLRFSHLQPVAAKVASSQGHSGQGTEVRVERRQRSFLVRKRNLQSPSSRWTGRLSPAEIQKTGVSRFGRIAMATADLGIVLNACEPSGLSPTLWCVCSTPLSPHSLLFFPYSFSLSFLEIGPVASCTLGKSSTTEPHPVPYFVYY